MWLLYNQKKAEGLGLHEVYAAWAKDQEVDLYVPLKLHDSYTDQYGIWFRAEIKMRGVVRYPTLRLSVFDEVFCLGEVDLDQYL